MTREEKLEVFAQELYNDGFRSADANKIRYTYILTPYETDVIVIALREIEKNRKEVVPYEGDN